MVLPLLGETIAHRLELAAIELEELRDETTRCLILAGIATALLICTGSALTFFLAGVVWETPHRTWWLGGLVAAYLIAALVTGHRLSRRIRNWRPLPETRAQLHEDSQCLNSLLKSAGS